MKFQAPSLVQTYIQLHYVRRIILRGLQKGTIFWGKTRCGKSTTGQIISSTSVCTFQDTDAQIKYKTKGLSQQQDPIGNQIESKTVVFNSKGQILDLPGVGDSRQIIYQIVNTYMRGDILGLKIPFKFVILVQESALTAPGNDFIDTIKSFLDNFQDFGSQFQKILESTVIVITKVLPGRQINNLHVKLKNYAQKVPAQLKNKEDQFKKLILGLIDKNKVLKFEQPSVAGQTLNGQNLKKSIIQNTKYNYFKKASIANYITSQIKKSSVTDKGNSFNQYIQENKNCVKTIGYGLQIVGEMVRNILSSPNEIITKQLMEKIIPFNQANQIYLKDTKLPDSLMRANLVRENLNYEKITTLTQNKNFATKKPFGKSQSSQQSGAQVKHYHALNKIFEQLTQDFMITSDSQTTTLLIKKFELIFYHLSGLINEKDRFQFVRLYYSLYTKLNFVYVAIQSLYSTKDEQIQNKFIQIDINTNISAFLLDISEKVYEFLKKSIPFYQSITKQKETLLLIKAHYTLNQKVTETHSIPYLQSTYKLLLDMKLKYSQKSQINTIIKIRTGKALYCLAYKNYTEKKVKNAVSYLVEGINLTQKIKQKESVQNAILSRKLLFQIFQNILKEPKPHQLIKKFIQQTCLKQQDLLPILKANNQTQSQFKIHHLLYQKEADKEKKLQRGIYYFQRLSFHLKDQAAHTLINKLYESLEQNIIKKRILNQKIITLLRSRKDRQKEFVKYSRQKENYDILPLQFLSRFYIGQQKLQQEDDGEEQIMIQNFQEQNQNKNQENINLQPIEIQKQIQSQENVNLQSIEIQKQVEKQLSLQEIKEPQEQIVKNPEEQNIVFQLKNLRIKELQKQIANQTEQQRIKQQQEEIKQSQEQQIVYQQKLLEIQRYLYESKRLQQQQQLVQEEASQ